LFYICLIKMNSMELSKKKGRYERIFIQLTELLKESPGLNSKLATINAVLHHKMDYFFWTGFYLLENAELTVGPYQGPVACQVLEKNKGVCWSALNQKKTIVVADIHKFPGHITCDSRSNSEIAIPLINNENIMIGVFDIDSGDFNAFDDIDKEWLEKIVGLVMNEQYS
jgi:L-methionine (R)-S-oxide reductase